VTPALRCLRLIATSVLLWRTDLPAQDAHWKVAPDGVAHYQRTQTTQIIPQVAPAPGFQFEFVGPDNPSVLFGRELDRTRVALRAPPHDLRELARAVAFDLTRHGRAGRRELTAPAVVPFGDVQLRIQQHDAGADGWQRIECSLRSRPPARPAGQPGHKALVQARLIPRCTLALAGTLVVERRFDAERGVVAAWRAKLDATLTSAAEPGKLALQRSEAWELRDVAAGRPRDLAPRVADAIARARAFLLALAADPDRADLAHRLERGQETRNSGRLALVLLALVHAEVPPDDPVLRAGFAALRQRPIHDTYSLALAILALEALHAPKHERRAILEGLQPGPRPRTLPPADLALVQGYSERLLANADTNADPARVLRFSYTTRAEYDNSNTHFAALGLHAADLCGAKVPHTAFLALARHYLAEQERASGKAQPLHLVLQGADGEADSKATVAARQVVAAGWPYRQGEEATGSMTAAGVASLALCRASLLRTKRLDRTTQGEIDGAVHAGFAWLSTHWTLLGNPSALRTEREWRTYHLYAIERACEYHRVATLDDIDWYDAGATWLLEVQAGDGHFPGWGYEDTVAATCMGLLFLKKAALPVHTR
jgi:hypothetical protein